MFTSVWTRANPMNSCFDPRQSTSVAGFLIEDKKTYWMVANIPTSTYDINFLANLILISFCCSQFPTLPYCWAHWHWCGASGRITVRSFERIRQLKNYWWNLHFNLDVDRTILTTLLEDLNVFLLAGAFVTTFCSCAERWHSCARPTHKLRKHNFTFII